MHTRSFLLFFFVLFAPTYQSKDEILRLQREQENSLLIFKSLITDTLGVLEKWDSKVAGYCSWTGVTCDGETGLVTSLVLSGMDLEGPLSVFLSNISSLQMLDLSNNGFGGEIPAQLGFLRNLQRLNLGKNNLFGSIPSSLANLSSLVTLDLSHNILIGAIPAALGGLQKLQSLNLGYNSLSGAIPSSITNLSSLVNLSLMHNSLSGSIPREIGAKLKNLRRLIIWENQLSGEIPASMGNLSCLAMLVANDNYLSGSIPVELGMLSELRRLKLHRNQLVSGEYLQNDFFTALGDCRYLEEISLGDNMLTGSLPESIGNLSEHLTLLSLALNNLEGTIPPPIGNLTSLTVLELQGNYFSGSIPAELGNLRNLQMLMLQRNQLEGQIDERMFRGFASLEVLDLSDNLLSGPLPDSVSFLLQLNSLFLQRNSLSGTIPAGLGDCKNLETIELSHNKLTGSIPKEIWKLSNTQLTLRLGSNRLQGQLPPEIGNMVNTKSIDVSANRLRGAIPVEVGTCRALETLNLSSNSFSGSISKEIGRLESLVRLDFSANSLSGEIPVSALRLLAKISFLNLSFNHFKGQIREGDFGNSQKAQISLQGNPGLCGAPQFGLSPCPELPNAKTFLLRILQAIGVLAIAFLLLLYIFWKRLKISFLFKFAPQSLKHQELLYKELVSATNGFDEANLLGRGNVGSVYKAVLSDGATVAVKVIARQDDEIRKSFTVENEVLSKIRHRNIVKLISSFSGPSFEGLVFEYISNGSLDNHLYCRPDEHEEEHSRNFGLQARLKTAIDVAHALEYLHHDSFIQVVHCDIKPANVLLDQDMSARLIDFGLSAFTDLPFSQAISPPNGMKGTTGYIAPEYGTGGQVSTKGDVYSYGILLLEMLTRKRPTNEMFAEGLTLCRWVALAFPERLTEIVDRDLLQETEREEICGQKAHECLRILFELGLLCSNESPQVRPHMRNVSRFLESARENLLTD